MEWIKSGLRITKAILKWRVQKNIYETLRGKVLTNEK
jgi:hypothetical protein